MSNESTKKYYGLAGLALILLLPLATSSRTFAQQTVREPLRQNVTADTQPGEPSGVRATQEAIGSNETDPATIMRAARRIFVRSKSLLVGAAVVEDKLLQRTEFQQLGLIITREEADADLILELRHDVLTMYVFSVVDSKTRIVVASGKLSSLGGTVAGKVAKRFLKQMMQARLPERRTD